MIIYLYRWKVWPGKEDQFESNWAIATKAIREEAGSLGSRLHKADNGEYIGYAQWPSAQTRESARLLSSSWSEARDRMREAIEFSYPEETLTTCSDYLVHQ